VRGREGAREGSRQAGARVYMREADGGQGGSRARRGNVSCDGTEERNPIDQGGAQRRREEGGNQTQGKVKLGTTGRGRAALPWPCQQNHGRQPTRDQPRQATWPLLPVDGDGRAVRCQRALLLPAARSQDHPCHARHGAGVWAETAPPSLSLYVVLGSGQK